jgi:hypothetical protein
LEVEIAGDLALDLPSLDYRKLLPSIGHQPTVACKEFANDCVYGKIRDN